MAELPLFQQIKLPSVKLNHFDLSYANHLTTDFGRITPILVKETLPADKITSLGSELFIRSLPLASPVMGRIKAYVHGFFVPNRIMWSHWERFISGWDGITVNDQIDPVPPYHHPASAYSVTSRSLQNYLGLPVGSYSSPAGNFKYLVFRFAAYQKVYDEWFRDQNVESPLDVQLSDGKITSSSLVTKLTTLRYRAFRKDYFTSALPWPQRGEQMTFPLGVSAPIKANESILQQHTPGIYVQGSPSLRNSEHNDVRTAGTDSDVPTTKLTLGQGWNNNEQFDMFDGFRNSPNGQVSNLYADLQAANVLTVNEFRRTMALQRWLETSARGGSRYNETLYAHFGVKIPDYRINRTQYLGGSSIQFNVEPVAQTAQDDSAPLGTLAGKAVAYGYCGILDKPFEPLEHGILLLLLSIMPDAMYFQGLDRHLTKFDKFDYAWPEFAHLGEQEVYKYEIFAGSGNLDTVPSQTFGYQSRFAEDKYSQNEVHGQLLDDAFFPWIVGRKKFGSSPTLGNTFIKVDPSDYVNIFAETSGDYDHFIVQCYNHYEVDRALPIFGTPE